MSNVADDFFCLLLDEHQGLPKLAPRVAGVGLAAGMLAELIVAGYAVVDEAGIQALDVQRPEDYLTRRVHELLLSRPQHRDLGVWLSFLAREAFPDVGERLTRLGVVTSVKKRRLTGSRTLYLPVDLTVVAWPGIRIARQLTGRTEITLADLTCAGLAAATGLLNSLLWDPELHATARAELPAALALLPPPVSALLARTETAVADAVLTNRT